MVQYCQDKYRANISLFGRVSSHDPNSLRSEVTECVKWLKWLKWLKWSDWMLHGWYARESLPDRNPIRRKLFVGKGTVEASRMLARKHPASLDYDLDNAQIWRYYFAKLRRFNHTTFINRNIQLWTDEISKDIHKARLILN